MKNKKVVLRLTEDQMRDVVLPYYIKEGKNDKNVLSEEIKNVSKGGRIIYSNKQTLDLPEFDPEFPRQMLGLNIEGYKRREVKVKRNKNDISKTIMVEVVTDYRYLGTTSRNHSIESPIHGCLLELTVYHSRLNYSIHVPFVYLQPVHTLKVNE